jgi:rhamnosyl/mannosyltransferase
LFVGRLIYYKGADVLVRAMEGVDADLVLVGRGPLESELRESVVARRMTDRVTFLPNVEQDELVAWYHAADVFALPSVARSEAFGLVQLEAHTSGTPVVSTNLTTGVPYVNEDGVTGLVVEPGDVRALADALDRLVNDDELRVRLGSQARERALERFTLDRMIEETLQLYGDVVGRRV